MKSIQYTIRAIPQHVDRARRGCARSEHKSLNAVLVEALEKATAIPDQPVIHHDLDEFIGTWVEDPAFDEAMKWFDRVDEDQWK